jgi:Sulfotransferase family
MLARRTMSRRTDDAKLPTFLGIGAPRAGTTWLHANLKKHPEIWLTPVKEIHYFDALQRGDPRGPFYRRHLQKRARRYATRETYRERWRDGTLFSQLVWDIHFFVPPRTHRWYQHVFRPGPGQIAGEITPAYSILKPELVEEVREINPDLRIIYLLRDPVERSWSSAISGLARRRGRSPEKITDKQLLRHFERTAHVLRTDYIRTFETWERVFGRDQIFIGFLDEIQQDPRDFLLRLYRFLGVSESEEHIPAGLGRKVNSSREYSTAIPQDVRIHLAELYLPQLQQLSARFGEPATDWLRRAEESLARSGAGSA